MNIYMYVYSIECKILQSTFFKSCSWYFEPIEMRIDQPKASGHLRPTTLQKSEKSEILNFGTNQDFKQKWQENQSKRAKKQSFLNKFRKWCEALSSYFLPLPLYGWKLTFDANVFLEVVFEHFYICTFNWMQNPVECIS